MKFFLKHFVFLNMTGLVLLLLPASPIKADTPFLGEIIVCPSNFAPNGFAFAHGQLLPINQNTALFSILGTTFGGDGITNFALPNLQGRAPIQSGQGPGLNNFTLGEHGGVDLYALNTNQMPAHTHALVGSNNVSDQLSPSGTLPASKNMIASFAAPGSNEVQMGNGIIGNAGGSPVDLRSPYLGMDYCIALQGIFPSRN